MTGLSGITFPGPVLLFVLNQSLARGFKSGLIATLAHAVVSGLIFVLILLISVAEIFKSPVSGSTWAWWAVIGLLMPGQSRDFAGNTGIYAWTLGIVAALFLWYGGISFQYCDDIYTQT